MRVQQSNIRDIKSVALKDFRGVDMASAPSDVAYFRATKMSNFIYEDGLNRKRKGIEQLFQIKPNIGESAPRINGIFDFTIEGTRLKIIYAGNRFYIVQDNGQYFDITTTQFTFDKQGNVELGAIIDNKFRVDVESGETTEGAHYLQDTRCQAFVSKDKIYFVGMGDYLVLGKFGGNNFELRKVYENEEYTTIPTTTMLIDQIGKYNESGKILDDVNILTRWRENRLVGSAFAESETKKSWRLDGQVDGNASITIEVSNTKEKIDLSVSDENAEVYRNLKVEDDISNKTLNFTPFSMGTVVIGANVVTTEKGDKLYLSGKYSDNSKECFDLMYSNGTTDTKIATYSRKNWTERWFPTVYENTITFGDCGKCTGLYVMFSSEFSGKFPMLGTKKITNGADEQVGYLEDNIITLNASVGDLSSSILGEDNIKVRYRADFDNSASERIRKAKIGTIFGINGADDRLFLADGSVTDTYSERNDFSFFGSMDYINTGTAPIVGYIRLGDSTLGVLKKDSTQDAALYVRSGQYLKETIDSVELDTQALFSTIPTNASVSAVGNIGNATLNNDSMILTRQGIYGVEIASNIATNQRLLKLRSNAINKGLLCLELDNVISIVYNNKMYVAQGGKCYVADARFKYRTDNDMGDTFNYEWWQLDLPCDIRCFAKFDDRLVIGTSDGRVIALQGTNYIDQVFDTYLQGQISITEDKKLTYGDGINIGKYQRLEFLQDTFPMYMGKFVRFDGDTIIIDDNTTYVPKKGETPQVNESDNTVVVTSRNLKGEKLHIVKYDNNKIVLRDDNGNVFTYFQSTDTANNDVRLYVIKPVQAEWYSAITDLGNCSTLKSLVSMTIAVDEQSRGKVQIGYETRRAGESIYESTSLGGLDFDNIDFNSFSFLPEFDCAFTKKVIARNFNYILFKVKSETPTQCALKEIIVRYKQTRIGRGVR